MTNFLSFMTEEYPLVYLHHAALLRTGSWVQTLSWCIIFFSITGIVKQHKIDHLSHPEARNSVALTKIVVLGNHPHHPRPRLSHHPTQEGDVKPKSPWSSASPGNSHSTFCRSEFSHLGVSCKWGHTVFVVMCLPSLSTMSSWLVCVVAFIRTSFSTV